MYVYSAWISGSRFLGRVLYRRQGQQLIERFISIIPFFPRSFLRYYKAYLYGESLVLPREIAGDLFSSRRHVAAEHLLFSTLPLTILRIKQSRSKKKFKKRILFVSFIHEIIVSRKRQMSYYLCSTRKDYSVGMKLFFFRLVSSLREAFEHFFRFIRKLCRDINFPI